MIPTHVAIIPDWNPDDFHCLDSTSEMRLIEECCRHMSEIMEEYSISHSYLRRGADYTRPGTLILMVGLSWFENENRKHNKSEVYYSDKYSLGLAKAISDSLGEWGRCSRFGHVSGCAKHREFDTLNHPGILGVKIEPFALNGPHIDEYLPRLRNLSYDMAMAIIEFIRSKNPMSGYRPLTVAAATGK